MEPIKTVLAAIRDKGEVYIWLAALLAQTVWLFRRSAFFRAADRLEKVFTALSAVLLCWGLAAWVKDFSLSAWITGFPGAYFVHLAVKLALALALAGAGTVLLLRVGKTGLWKKLRPVVDFFGTESVLRRLAVIVFVAAVLWTSWQSDDAYHAFIMTKHLVEGDGLVYNIGYRVTASTCPLFTLLVAAVYLVVRHIQAASLLVSGGCCAGLAYIVFYRFCKTRWQIVWAEAAMLGCYCFMTYTTAGLENAPLYLLGALFLLLFLGKSDYTPKQLLWMALLAALVAWTRMDAVLLFVPMACYAYLAKTRVPFVRRVGIGLLGLSPFFVWEVFSVIYYGYPFPNTMYCKLNTGFPKEEYVTRGLDFLWRTFACDLFTLLIPLVFLALAVYKRSADALWLGSGIVLYTVYVVTIGGDFMLGRHLTMQFILSLCGLLWLPGEKTGAAAKPHPHGSAAAVLGGICLLCLVWRVTGAVWFLGGLYEDHYDSGITSVADEKGVYFGKYGTVNYLRNGGAAPEEGTEDVQAAVRRGEKGFLTTGMVSGRLAWQSSFTGSGDLYLTDAYGLMDPLLSHLPAIYTGNWRVGHLKRAIPPGYAESVQQGENLIEDPGLHAYYDKILLIIQGDLWDPERLQTIWKMNTGQYEYLLEHYLQTLE